MAHQSTHDSYIYLQVMLKELTAEGQKTEEYGYNYQKLIENIDIRIKDLIRQSIAEISDFKVLIDSIKKEVVDGS